VLSLNLNAMVLVASDVLELDITLLSKLE
jgi:hypothetical protein